MTSAPSRRESLHGSHKSIGLFDDGSHEGFNDERCGDTHRCVLSQCHTLAAAATVGVGVDVVGGVTVGVPAVAEHLKDRGCWW